MKIVFLDTVTNSGICRNECLAFYFLQVGNGGRCRCSYFSGMIMALKNGSSKASCAVIRDVGHIESSF